MLLSGGLLYYVADTTIILHTGSKSEIFWTLSTCVELVVFSKLFLKELLSQNYYFEINDGVNNNNPKSCSRNEFAPDFSFISPP